MIYFIQAGDSGPIKIGYTGKPIEQRMYNISVACPYDIHLVKLFDGGEGHESYLHILFAPFNHRRDWFYPVRQILEFNERDLLDRSVPGFWRAVFSAGSQIKLANLIGVDAVSISKYRNGAPIPPDVALKISSATDVPIEDIIADFSSASEAA